MVATKKTTAKKVSTPTKEKKSTFDSFLNTIKYNPVGSIAFLLLIISIAAFFSGNPYLEENGLYGIFGAYCLSVMAIDTRPNGIPLIVVLILSFAIIPFLFIFGTWKMIWVVVLVESIIESEGIMPDVSASPMTIALVLLVAVPVFGGLVAAIFSKLKNKIKLHNTNN